MSPADNYNKYKKLRVTFPNFVYERYAFSWLEKLVKIRFTFSLSGRYFFYPEIEIPVKPFFDSSFKDMDRFRNVVFHIGMIELISYWKATCSPRIIIKPHKLNEDQLNWWKHIYYQGLGEFFYMNSIPATKDDFVEISCDGDHELQPTDSELNSGYLVPVGGGKDSAVSLELLSEHYSIRPLIINPRRASLDTAKMAGFRADDMIIVNRCIHQQLLDLNAQGFLNGHTPFSALLAFVSLLAAMLSGSENIALSNESSANEATIRDTDINHQYSKSFAFEKDFREYVQRYISGKLNYFSFLRPLTELQIAALFSRFPQYHDIFRSCNAGSKEDIWCGNCPKCLFTYIILSPFIEDARLINIFGASLMNNAQLLQVFDQLTGVHPVKPFECVGTVDEVHMAMQMAIGNGNLKKTDLLVKHYLGGSGSATMTGGLQPDIIRNFNNAHFVPAELEKLLKQKQGC